MSKTFDDCKFLYLRGKNCLKNHNVTAMARCDRQYQSGAMKIRGTINI
ncbi:MAG: hypothetical protein GDA43_02810 [Hormoscilla sp. SP5CHS1]|nr:hypothetical protein [Hormoscilla sp. SP5CHS1]MBC6474377.1 hypothetical protein [Hormoscilla sp. GM102CHS1]